MMNNPQQKAWAMKHPALAKAFAVALVVMSLILLFAGIKGFTEREDEYEERLRYEDRFRERIDNYIDLSAQLENSISYDEAWAELEKLIEQHEDDASQHKTDLAMYSAEKGGNTMGANMVWEMMPEILGAKQELQNGKKQLAAAEAQLQQAKAGFQMGGGDSMAAAAGQGAAKCSGYIAQLSGLISAIDAEPEKPGEAPPAAEKPEPELTCPTEPVAPVEPAYPAAPVMPLEPVAPVEPVLPENPTEEQQAEYDALKAQYDAGLAAYNAYSEEYPALLAAYEAALPGYNETLAQYEADKAAYDTAKAEYDVLKAQYDTEYAAYQVYAQQLADYEAYAAYLSKAQAYSDWMNKCMALIGQTNLVALGAELQSQGQALEALSGPAMALMSAFADMFGIEMPDMGSATPAAAAAGDMGGMSPEQMLSAARAGAVTLKENFATVQGGYSGIAYGLGLISQGIAKGEAELEAGKAQLAAGEEMLKKGEHEAQKALEDIWYNLGELEKDRVDLAEQKTALDEESAMLSKEIKAAEELRELENDRVSAKLLLTSVKEVNDMFEESGELVPSAEKYLESYKAETEALYSGRLVVCVLALIGGIAGLAGIPAVYELVRKRFWLIWPVVLCIVCAAAAEAMYFKTVHEMWYVGLFVAIIAALHLLIVAPKEKKPIIKET